MLNQLIFLPGMPLRLVTLAWTLYYTCQTDKFYFIDLETQVNIHHFLIV